MTKILNAIEHIAVICLALIRTARESKVNLLVNIKKIKNERDSVNN